MNEGLCLSYKPDTDATGELTVRACAGGFSGVGAAWFGQPELLEFARRLADEYPLSAERSYRLRGGYWSSSQPPTLEHVHVGLEFYVLGPLGHIGCSVELAAPSYGAGPAEREPRIKLELVTAYEPLRAFARGLQALVEGHVPEATLEAHGA